VALTTLARDPERRFKVGRNGFDKVGRSLRVEQKAAQVRAVYEEVLDETRTRRPPINPPFDRGSGP
jgi:hypothetical protein